MGGEGEERICLDDIIIVEKLLLDVRLGNPDRWTISMGFVSTDFYLCKSEFDVIKNKSSNETKSEQGNKSHI